MAAESQAPQQRAGWIWTAAWVALLCGAIWFYVWGSWATWMPLSAAIRGGDSRYMLQEFRGQKYGGPLSGNDFKHIYVGSLLLWQGEDAYDFTTLQRANAEITGPGGMNPYVYPPFTGLAMGWLLLFSYTEAFLVWFVASHVMIWLAVAASFAALRLRWSWRAAAFAALVVAMSGPLRRSLSAGQLNAPLALAYPLFWLALSRRKDWLAGLIGALAMLYKLSPGIMLIYLLWTRRWRAAGWMVLASVFLMAITLAWSGVGAHLDFIPLLLDMGYGRSTWGQNYYCAEANQSLNSLFHHLFAVTPIGTAPLLDLGPATANWLTRAATALLLAAALAVSWRRRPRDSDESPDSSEPSEPSDGSDQALVFCLFIFVSLFVPSLCWDHYFIQLLFPILAMYQALDNRRSAMPAIPYIVGLFLVFLPIIFWDQRYKSGFGLIQMSCNLWGALALFGVNLWLLRGGEGAPAAK